MGKRKSGAQKRLERKKKAQQNYCCSMDKLFSGCSYCTMEELPGSDDSYFFEATYTDSEFNGDLDDRLENENATEETKLNHLQLQLAIGVKSPPIILGGKRDAKIYSRMKQKEVYVKDTDPCSKAYEVLGFLQPPSTIGKLLERTSEENEKFNDQYRKIKFHLSTYPEEIPEKNPYGEYSRLALYKKIYYLAKKYKFLDKLPENLSAEDGGDELLIVLEAVKNSITIF